MERYRPLLLLVTIAAIIGAIAYLESLKSAPSGAQQPITIPITAPASSTPSIAAQSAENRITKKSMLYPRALDISMPDGFINADPFSLKDLVGKKVILLDFWAYSCINCQRTIPYLNSWYAKYKDKGLVIVGIHTPEFDFEKQYGNVAAAVKKFGIQYPVVLDNGYSTWMAYQNQYWPREYLIDIDGFIVHDHIGEGDYQNTESQIQAALEERARMLGLGQDVEASIANTALTSETSPPSAGSPETYFGAARNAYLGNGAQGTLGPQSLSLPDSFALNTLYLSGSWNFQDQFAENTSADAHIVYHYSAQDVYFVAAADTPVSVTVLRDGKPMGAAAGADVPTDGTVSIHTDQLYKLVHDLAGSGEHTLELIIHGPGLRAYTFTFG